MAGMVVVDVGDIPSDVVMGFIISCLDSELISYYFTNKRVCKKIKCWPCMGMAGIVINSMGDVATVVVVVGVVIAHVVI